MNIKEVGEIRRRLRRDRTNITTIYGCYVNGAKEVISSFSAKLATMPENEADKYMALLKAVLGGSLGKTLTNLSFPTANVAGHDPAYMRLMALRKDMAHNESQRQELFQAIIETKPVEDDYLILLGCDTYDVLFKSKDDATQADAGDTEFRYIVCAVCPVKATKSMLHYAATEKKFADGGMLQAANAPVVGFMYPAFDERATNLYGALYFNKDKQNNREEFAAAALGISAPPAMHAQRSVFGEALSDALEDECSFDVVKSLHKAVSDRLELAKEAKIPEPLTLGVHDMESIIASNGVSKEKAEAFADRLQASFGTESELLAATVVDAEHFVVKTMDAVIKVDKHCTDNVQVREFGGQKYLCIPVENDSLEVNGIAVAL